jgi:hypothetical protein
MRSEFQYGKLGDVRFVDPGTASCTGAGCTRRHAPSAKVWSLDIWTGVDHRWYSLLNVYQDPFMVVAKMAIEGIWFWFISDFYAHDDTASWSVDLHIPEQTVYASATLSRYDNSQDYNKSGDAFCNILEYNVKVASDQVPEPRFPGSNVPAIMDNNVVKVSFGYGVTNSNADCHFQIMGFGQ